MKIMYIYVSIYIYICRYICEYPHSRLDCGIQFNTQKHQLENLSSIFNFRVLRFSCLYPSKSFGVLFGSEEVDLKAFKKSSRVFFRSQVGFQVGWSLTPLWYRRPWSAFHTLHPAMSALETECFCLDDLPIGRQRSNAFWEWSVRCFNQTNPRLEIYP